MKKMLAVLALLFACLIPAAAKYAPKSLTASDGQGNFVNITSGPCQLAFLAPDHKINWGAWTLRYHGKDYTACWLLKSSDGIVYILSADGDLIAVQATAFKPDVEV